MDAELSAEALAVLAGDDTDDETPVELHDQERIEKLMWALHYARKELAAVEESWQRDIARLSEARDAAIAPLRNKMESLTSLVTGWHRAVYEDAIEQGMPDKKLPRSVKLKAGTLKSVAGRTTTGIEDEAALVAWAKANGHTDLVTVTEKVMASAVKSLFTDGKPVTADGELIPGVTVKVSDRSFTVKGTS